MARPLAAEVVVTLTRLGDGSELLVPLSYPEHVSLGEPVSALVKRLHAAWQRSLLDTGRALEFAQVLGTAPVGVTQLEVSFEAPRRGARYPAHTRVFEMAHVAYASGVVIGLVPALGIEASGVGLDALREAMVAAIRLEFIRSRRLRDGHRLASVSLFGPLSVERHPVTLSVHTPAEVEALARDGHRSVLDTVASAATRPLDEPVGLRVELEAMIRAVDGLPPRSVLIVGPNGSGKTALLGKYLCQPSTHASARHVWATDAASLLQWLTREGGWQGGLAQLVTELRDSGALLYVNHLHELFEVGQYEGNSLSLGDALREPLERGEILLVAESTEAVLAALETRSPGISAHFEIVRMQPGDAAQRRELVRAAIRAQATRGQFDITDGAIDTAQRLHQRFFPYSGFPGKSVRFLEAMLIEEKNRAQHEPSAAVTRERVLDGFCLQSGIPPAMVDERVEFDVDQLGALLREQVIAQDDAVASVVDVLARIRTGLMRDQRPLANLLFVGPTGVGKTELAKALARFLFGDAGRLLRLDMSEYSDAQSVLRLTGDLLASGASLASRIRQRPFSVVLFDEIEKAHPNFHDLLLQILGDGRLTDARGQVSSFCSAIIIMTSNIGAQEHQRRGAGFSLEESTSPGSVLAHFRHAVEGYFRPELFNRLDQVIPFAALDAKTQPLIARRAINELMQRAGISEGTIPVAVDPAVEQLLGRTGQDTRFGAREIRRAVYRSLTVPLAQVRNGLRPNAPVAIEVQAREDELTIETRPRATVRNDVPIARCDALATARRHLQAIADGPVYIALDNERARLAESKRQRGQKFWADTLAVDRYRQLDALCAEVVAQREAALEREGTAMLALFDAASEHGEHAGDESWHNSIATLRRSLHDARYPEAKRCTIGVFGPVREVDTLLTLYTRLAKARAMSCVACRVRLDGESYSVQREPLSAAERSRSLPFVGRLLEVEGECALLYFLGEAGVQRFRSPTGKVDNCFVHVTAGPSKAFTVPGDVHRRSFFEAHTVRRSIDEAGVHDKTFAFKLSGLNDPRFESALAERFDAALDAALTGIDAADEAVASA